MVFYWMLEEDLKGGQFDIADDGTSARRGYLGDYAEVTQAFETLRPRL